MNYLTEKWIATDISFTTTKTYNKLEQFYVIMDVEFINRDSKKTYNIPCFWDGENIFKARFAPTELGIWDFTTKCETDESLNGIKGTVECTEYTGDLELYKHGFIKAVSGTKYFVYDDGTPFFYLGDTHWNMFTEEFDSAGDHAIGIETDSHFKYIVKKRISQGFNMYQSEPLGGFNLDAGFSEDSLKEFQHADKYFKYLADNGITHANAQFFFCTRITEEFFNDGNKLEILARYWCARYSAYPVMWTLAQECDNDMYDEHHPGRTWWNYANNPWVKVAEFMHKYDAYNHPLSGHQESAIWTTITGEGAYFPKKSNGGRSVFADDDVSARCGHDWWATQWKHPVYKLPHALSAKEYWNSPKVAINYEDFYCNLWTNNFGARSRAWISILSGLFGYGYGAADIWLYKGSFEMDRDAIRMDGYTTITIAEKNIPWSESVELESAYQVGYMKRFFESFDWWKLVPDFDNKVSFTPEDDITLYACATIKNDLYVIYLFSTDTKSGVIGNMDADSTYTLQWYNPRTNEYSDTTTIKANTTDNNGSPAYELKERPDVNDWVALIKKT